MMLALWGLLWWLSAFVPLLWMGEPGWRQITPKDLLITGGLSIMGPFLGLIIVVAVVSSLDFWNEPIFGRKKDDD